MSLRAEPFHPPTLTRPAAGPVALKGRVPGLAALSGFAFVLARRMNPFFGPMEWEMEEAALKVPDDDIAHGRSMRFKGEHALQAAWDGAVAAASQGRLGALASLCRARVPVAVTSRHGSNNLGLLGLLRQLEAGALPPDACEGLCRARSDLMHNDYTLTVFARALPQAPDPLALLASDSRAAARWRRCVREARRLIVSSGPGGMIPSYLGLASSALPLLAAGLSRRPDCALPLLAELAPEPGPGAERFAITLLPAILAVAAEPGGDLRCAAAMVAKLCADAPDLRNVAGASCAGAFYDPMVGLSRRSIRSGSGPERLAELLELAGPAVAGAFAHAIASIAAANGPETDSGEAARATLAAIEARSLRAALAAPEIPGQAPSLPAERKAPRL